MNDNFVKSEKVYMKYDKIKSFINLLLKYIKQNDSLLDDSVCIFTQDSILDILILIALNRAGKNGILIEKDAKYEEIVRRAKLVKSNTIIVCNQNLREDYFTIFNIAEEKDLLVTGSFNYKIDKEDDISSSYAIICTSGSTDLPKLVYKQNKIIEEHAKLLQKLYELTTEDTVLIIVPCQHAYGLEHFMAAFKSGANIIVQNEFNIGEILELILNEPISVIVGSPYQYVFIDRAIHNVLEIDNLRMLLSAGMAMEEKISLSLEKNAIQKLYKYMEVQRYQQL